MSIDNRPLNRKQNKVGGTGNVSKRGAGLGLGPVGGASSSGNKASSTGSSFGNNGRKGPGLLYIVIAVAVLLLGGGKTLLGGLLGNGSIMQDIGDISQGQVSEMDILSGIFETVLSSYNTSSAEFTSYSTNGNGNYNSSSEANTTSADTSVALGSRDKRTSIIGSNADIVTIMVYMCGTDLESKSGMGTADLQEMAAASLSENVNLIVYTGGCTNWRNNVVSSKTNQIYQIKDGGLKCLKEDAGNLSMTDPKTLTDFIKFCNQNFPANRNELIFWDHGSGSVNGFGYDEKFARSGSMTLAGIDTALKNAGCVFDFIGFDACLMATVENGLMLSKYADYMIASEETEPGVGWYYTNWLTKLSNNSSMPTVEIGKSIVDDFVDVCAAKCSGQKATLSVVDLAELENTVPSALRDFSVSTSELLEKDNGYEIVSTARNSTKEFAQSSKIDQIDFVHFAKLLDTPQSNTLAEALLGCVKYNRTEKSINNAYGLSIYFPYKKVSKLESMVSTYEKIGMDSEYTRCIREFASNESSGQYSENGSYTSGSLLAALLGRSIPENVNEINTFDEKALVWTKNSSGQSIIKLTDSQWNQVALLDLNLFYDDGEGFIELGLDNIYSFDNDGNLIGDFDNSWLSIDGQVVAYYHTDTEENGDNYTISGYVPAFLNGDRVELLLVFDNAHPDGYISGARYIYADGETDTVAKSMVALSKGDRLEFICDYYTYDGQFEDCYYLGEAITIGDEIIIGNIDLGDSNVKVTYVFTDIYQQKHVSPVLD